MNHYEVLGVSRSASPADVRAAYRRAARAAHPDRHGTGSADRMARVNEAWRVLGDPAQRQSYDRTLADTVPGRATAGTDHVPDRVAPAPPVGPAKVPWRFMIGMAVAGIGLLVIGRLFTSPSAPAGPDGILRADDCVTLSATFEATEVLCGEPYDATVRVLVPFDQQCPTGTEGYRDRQGMGIACVVKVAP